MSPQYVAANAHVLKYIFQVHMHACMHVHTCIHTYVYANAYIRERKERRTVRREVGERERGERAPLLHSKIASIIKLEATRI